MSQLGLADRRIQDLDPCCDQRARGRFPPDDAASKLILLAARDITAGRAQAAHHWKEAMHQFAILYDDRFNAAG